jgi:hypothetical protein
VDRLVGVVALVDVVDRAVDLAVDDALDLVGDAFVGVERVFHGLREENYVSEFVVCLLDIFGVAVYSTRDSKVSNEQRVLAEQFGC